MYCNQCGNEIKKGQCFCTKCGNKIENNIQETKNNYNNEFLTEIIIKLIDKSKMLIEKFKKLNKTLQTVIIATIIVLVVLPFTINDKDNSSSSKSLSSKNSSSYTNSSQTTSYQTGVDIRDWRTIKNGTTYSQVISTLGYPLSTQKYPNGYGYNAYPCTVLTYNVIQYGESQKLHIVLENSYNIVCDKDDWQ